MERKGLLGGTYVADEDAMPHPRGPIRRALQCLPVILLLLFVAPLQALSDTRQVVATSLGATQEGIGIPNVKEMLAHVVGQHMAHPKYKNKSFATYVEKVQKPKLAKKSFEGVVDPSGVVRILDGHHRAKLAITMQQMTGVELRVPVVVVADFKAQMDKAKTDKARRAVHESYARTLLVDMRKGQFTNYTKSKYPLKGGISSLLARVNKFKLVSEVKNDAMRSAVGSALFHMKVNPDNFIDYAEFRIGDWIRRNPKLNREVRANIQRWGPTDRRTFSLIQNALKTSEGYKLMKRFVRPGHELAAQSSLNLIRSKSLGLGTKGPLGKKARKPVMRLSSGNTSKRQRDRIRYKRPARSKAAISKGAIRMSKTTRQGGRRAKRAR